MHTIIAEVLWRGAATTELVIADTTQALVIKTAVRFRLLLAYNTKTVLSRQELMQVIYRHQLGIADPNQITALTVEGQYQRPEEWYIGEDGIEHFLLEEWYDVPEGVVAIVFVNNRQPPVLSQDDD